jgi:two-component system chemotaxis sensor kinase CheA
MAKDPYKYFRIEARELLEQLTQGILHLEKYTVAPDFIARLLRVAHTLKGAARVVKQASIAELVHRFEGLLAGHREAAQPLSKAEGSELLRLLDEITSLLQALEPTGDREAKGPARAAAEEPLETLRVEMHEMDSLLRGVTEAAVQLGAVRKDLGATGRLRDLTELLVDQLAARPGDNGAGASAALSRARSLTEDLRTDLDRLTRSLAGNIERAEGRLGEIRDIAHRLRLIPAQTVFPSLDRAVRDASQALGRRVDFQATGGEVRLDANVLASLRDALMHVVRNAVTHGIEDEAERIAAGKPPGGRVQLTVERRGARVSFTCADDGRGVDVEAVRKAAVARGLVDPSEAHALPADQILTLLRTGGLTTSGHVTELSGRGIGLDVVRATAARLKGEMNIRSEPGRGATVEVQVPVSIASLQGLVVEAAGAAATIPLDAVRQALRVSDTDVARSPHGESILHDDQVIPFLPLERILRLSGSNRHRPRAWSAVVVQAGNRSVAVGADRLLGTCAVIMRPLPDLVEADSVVSGASLDAEGNPQLVLDPSGLVAAAERGLDAVHDEGGPQHPPILVIDDSLTTRMLEQSILESAGYEVDLAVSGEEALAKARARAYSLFIVDVEMPGMDGFGFMAEARSDPTLRDVPAILVTSRSAVEDRRRGEQAGARAYIVKNEFDQQQLVNTIRRLIG